MTRRSYVLENIKKTSVCLPFNLICLKIKFDEIKALCNQQNNCRTISWCGVLVTQDNVGGFCSYMYDIRWKRKCVFVHTMTLFEDANASILLWITIEENDLKYNDFHITVIIGFM